MKRNEIIMERYVCIRPLQLEKYDENGFVIDNSYIDIAIGEIWTVEQQLYNSVASNDAIHLARDFMWIEIYQDTLNTYFELIEEKFDFELAKKNLYVQPDWNPPENKTSDIFDISEALEIYCKNYEKEKEKYIKSLVEHGFITEEQEPIRCLNCGSDDFKMEVIDYIQGIGVSEERKICLNCKKEVAYWAHGYWSYA